MTKITAGLALLYCIAKVGNGLWYVAHPNPFDLPGQTWDLSFIFGGDTLRLLDSGKYLHYHWCDICDPDDSEAGSWSTSGYAVTLVPDSPATPQRSYIARQIGSCRYLVPANGRFKDQLLFAFQPEHQHCRHGL